LGLKIKDLGFQDQRPGVYDQKSLGSTGSGFPRLVRKCKDFLGFLPSKAEAAHLFRLSFIFTHAKPGIVLAAISCRYTGLAFTVPVI
jgi:hypothetical protein